MGNNICNGCQQIDTTLPDSFTQQKIQLKKKQTQKKQTITYKDKKQTKKQHIPTKQHKQRQIITHKYYRKSYGQTLQIKPTTKFQKVTRYPPKQKTKDIVKKQTHSPKICYQIPYKTKIYPQKAPVFQTITKTKDPFQKIQPYKDYKRYSLDRRTLDKKPLDEKPLDRRSLDRRSLDEKPLDRRSLDRRSLDKRTLDEKSLDEKPLDRRTLEKRSESKKDVKSFQKYLDSAFDKVCKTSKKYQKVTPKFTLDKDKSKQSRGTTFQLKEKKRPTSQKKIDIDKERVRSLTKYDKGALLAKYDCKKSDTVVSQISTFDFSDDQEEDYNFHGEPGIKRYFKFTSKQIEALNYIKQQSKKNHQELSIELQIRFKNLVGLTAKDLKTLKTYIQQRAPIIIHFHAHKHLELYLKDTHYRNQFQTGTSHGTLSTKCRKKWENRMFDYQYKGAKKYQRVKYGVLNFTKDLYGVQCAQQYGKSYFVLNDNLRRRCTLTNKDSSYEDAVITNFKYCYPIIDQMTNDEIYGALKGKDSFYGKGPSSSMTRNYKQVQIHGPVSFKRDIYKMYISKSEISLNSELTTIIQDFTVKFGIKYEII